MTKQTEVILDKMPKHSGLGWANITTDSVSVDEFASEAFEPVLPEITFEIIDQYASDVLDGMTDAYYSDPDNAEQWELAVERFKDSNGYSEWENSFYPMMLCYWPVFLGHSVDATRAATLMDKLCIACSLVEITGDNLREAVGEDHAIVLTGGGMNLCDHIVAAYLACEEVPPLRLLTGLKGVIGTGRMAQIAPRLKEAFAEAKSFLKREQASVIQAEKELFAGAKKGINPHA